MLKAKSAKELMDKLNKDQIYVIRMQQIEKKRAERHAKYQEAARRVLADLADAGFAVQSVGELVQQFSKDRIPYVAAIPILMKWLPLVDYDALKEDIVRTLSVPWAKPLAASLMVDEYLKAHGSEDNPPSSLRWAIGNALRIVADDTVFDDLVRIAMDRQFGQDREMVVEAFGNMKNPRVIEVMIALLDDEEVAGHAVVTLGKLKANESIPHLKRFLNHPKAWVRKEAKKAITYISNK